MTEVIILCCAVVLRRVIGVRGETEEKSSLTDIRIGEHKKGEETVSTQSCKAIILLLFYLYHVFRGRVFQVYLRCLSDIGCGAVHLHRDRLTGWSASAIIQLRHSYQTVMLSGIDSSVREAVKSQKVSHGP